MDGGASVGFLRPLTDADAQSFWRDNEGFGPQFGTAARYSAAPDDLFRKRGSTLGRKLLTLDTRVGDTAEQLYTSLGYSRAGEIPRYVMDETGGIPGDGILL